MPGRILEGGDSSNYTLSRRVEPGAALAPLSSCLAARWAAARLDTPDHLARCAASSSLAVLGLDTALAATEDIVSTDGAVLLPALDTLDPQVEQFAK